MKDELLNIGLSKYEAECYLCLLQHGDQKGNEIARKTNIPRTSTYPTLERLETKRFIHKIQENPKIYKAIRPKIAIGSYIDRQSKVLANHGNKAIKKLGNIKDEKEESVVNIYFGKEQSHRAAKNTQEHITTEYLGISDGFNRNSLIYFFKTWKSMATRGVNTYLIMPIKRKTQASLEYLIELKKYGVNIGFYEFKNLSFTVSDRKKASIAVKSDKIQGGRVVVVINNEDFAVNQASFFFDIWKKCEKF